MYQRKTKTGEMFNEYILNEAGKSELNEFKKLMAAMTRRTTDLMPEGHELDEFRVRIEEATYFGSRAICSKEGNHCGLLMY